MNPEHRIITQFTPTNNHHDALAANAKATGRIQVRRVPVGQPVTFDMWLLAIPTGDLFWINVPNALDNEYICEAIGYEPSMTYDRVAWLLGMWHAQHTAFCSTVRSSADTNGVGVTRRESA